MEVQRLWVRAASLGRGGADIETRVSRTGRTYMYPEGQGKLLKLAKRDTEDRLSQKP